MFMGKTSVACSIIFTCMGPGVQVVAHVPLAGPVPPPSMVVSPEERASSHMPGQMKCTCASIPPAVTMSPEYAVD